MATHWFSPPVYVTDGRGATYGCNNVEDAAEELMKWTRMGPKWRKAVQLCVEALQDRVIPEEVRQAFEAAAKEEGVLRSSG
ncbi:DUF982 domain-containing protein [Mesorhizobium sp. M0998]|uniref:DUF982 domain-containing protein n=1 Tax=Mesorhizobium sp. M0998 TaxID=2957044 RepID=UPI00333AA667